MPLAPGVSQPARSNCWPLASLRLTGFGLRLRVTQPKIGQLRFEDAAADLLLDFTTNKKRSYSVVERRIRLSESVHAIGSMPQGTIEARVV
jgi:hypothetical protein